MRMKLLRVVSLDRPGAAGFATADPSVPTTSSKRTWKYVR